MTRALIVSIAILAAAIALADDAPVDMIAVPAGAFTMGSERNPDEQPVHRVHLAAFRIDRTEVTQAEFARFLNEIGDHETGCGGRRCVTIESEHPRAVITRSADGYAAHERFANHPATFVTWHGASAYCASRQKRLPTEAEWEKAARGDADPAFYPWGEENDAARVVDADTRYGGRQRTRTVGSFPANASPFGALDMAGNVMEWVSDAYRSDCYARHAKENPVCVTDPETGAPRVLRGGSFYNNLDGLKVGKRYHDLPDASQGNYGFRCAASP
ncbi:formylglycine-generating enzyme family protein [bacterium]|nr:formylglycine-generating enzyme family protein [bacterium]